MKRRATLKDIANALNISVTTVSRALNDKDDISPKTKEAVLEVARMLEYKPNAMAVSLRKNVANKIVGVILPAVEHHFFSTILKGIMTAAHLSDYMIMMGESNQDFNKERKILQHFGDHLVSGVILSPSRHPDSPKNVALLRSMDIPFILIDRKFDDYTGSFLQHDDYSGAYAAVSHLIAQGYKRIAHIRGDETCNISSERFKGYISALSDHGIPIDHHLVKSCLNARKEDGYRNTAILFDGKYPNPDAIFTVTDHVASGVYEYAKDHGINIPKELGVVGYSNSEVADHLSPKLSTVEQNGHEMGRTSFNFLIEQIKNRQSVFQRTFSTKLLIRESSMPKV